MPGQITIFTALLSYMGNISHSTLSHIGNLRRTNTTLSTLFTISLEKQHRDGTYANTTYMRKKTDQAPHSYGRRLFHVQPPARQAYVPQSIRRGLYRKIDRGLGPSDGGKMTRKSHITIHISKRIVLIKGGKTPRG